MQTKEINNVQQLLTQHLDIWTTTETEKKSGRGRSSSGGNKGTVYGIQKLRELMLELAVRGKLVPQDPNDEPASELLKRIQAEKAKLIAEGKLKKEKPLAPIAEDEKPFELPKGWELVRISDVAFPQAGFAFKSNSFNEFGNGLPLIRIRDVGQNFTGTYYDGEYREEFLVRNGDYLISMDGEFRVATWKLNDALLNQRVSRLIFFGKETSQDFVCHFLQNRLRELQGTKAYTTVDHLSGSQISNSVIGLPPLSEQHRIIAKVDELMALCDQLENQHLNAAEAHDTLVSELLTTLTQSQNAADFNDNWQRIYAHFDVLFTTEASIDALKQTLLQLAVMGKLVPQDPNDEPASELHKRIQAEKAKLIAEGKLKKEKPLAPISEDEKSFETPNGWIWVRLNELLTKIGAGSTPLGGKQVYVYEGVPFLRSQNVWDDGLRLDDVAFITDETHNKMSGTHVFSGDLLFNITGASIGRCAIVPDSFITGNVSQHVTIIRPVSSQTLRFMHLVLISQHIQQTVMDVQVGVSREGLSIGKLSQFVIPMPPLAEQQRIVAKVDELMAMCDLVRTLISNSNQLQHKLADVMVEKVLG